MKTTAWYPAIVAPVRKGVYEIRYSDTVTFFRYWNGRYWCLGNFGVDEARQNAKKGRVPKGPMPWRGLRNDPKPLAWPRVTLAQRHVEAIHRALVKHGMQTIHEIAENTGLTFVQVARRLPEISHLARVLQYITRPSPSGRPCRVWCAK